MAVWLYAYGRNGCLDQTPTEILKTLNNIEVDAVQILECVSELRKNKPSIQKHYTENRKQIEKGFYAKTDEEYSAYLKSVKFPAVSRDSIVDYLIEDGLKREAKEEEHFQRTYKQFKEGVIQAVWKKGDSNTYFNRLHAFRSHDGLRVWFLNDLIGVSGPFQIFSYYGTFIKGIQTERRAYFHSLFKRIMSAFKSEFILYTHEWAGLEDEVDQEFNLKKLKSQSNW
ncbi:MAG: hypothetical protein N4A46_01040, partial [Schleiferiaceae bacterium]|nr:hypothetical protein [Schleiferiaceae bacterium]